MNAPKAINIPKWSEAYLRGELDGIETDEHLHDIAQAVGRVAEYLEAGDHPAFVMALCPNCRRHLHAGAHGTIQFEAGRIDEGHRTDRTMV
jgi:hypothetical protein